MANNENDIPLRRHAHEVTSHGQRDILGTEHKLHYQSGDEEPFSSFRFGRVDFQVGGARRNWGGTDVITDFSAHIDSPRAAEARLNGRFARAQEPDHEELETLADGLMLVISQPLPNMELITVVSRFALDLGPNLESIDNPYENEIDIRLARRMKTITSKLLNEL